MTGSRGPRATWPRQLLEWTLHESDREEVLGDLDERYRLQGARLGARTARRWYRRQLATLLLWAIGRRVAGGERGAGGVEGRSSDTTSGGDGMGTWLAGGLGTDVRLAARALLGNPAYALVAVVTLALGIGGNTAVFSVVDGVLLRPLPFHEPEQLVAIHETRTGQSWWAASPTNVRAWRARSRTLADVAWAQPRQASLLDPDGEPEAVLAVATSYNLFDLLGVRPHLGRFFVEGEDQIGAEPVVLLTHDSWVGRFGADRDVLGSRLTVDGRPHTVVGVVPAGREPTFFGDHEIVLPRILTENEVQSQGRILRTIGRVTAGTGLDAAREEMAALGAELDAASPGGSARGWGVRLVPLKEEMVGAARTPLLVLLGAVGFVLLIACTNLSNLMLARGRARATDLAVRASLGADRARLVRHLLVEALLVSMIGGVLGLALAVWGTGWLLAIDPGVLPRLDRVSPDLRVFGFTAGLSVFAAVLFGLVPALRVTRIDLAASFQAGSGRGGTGRGENRLRASLVAAEVALVVVLLVGAGVMVRSVQALGAADPGFQTQDRIAIRITVPEARYPDTATIARFMVDLTDRMRTVPGVVAAGSVTTLPLTGSSGYTSFQLARSLPVPEAGAEPLGGMEVVTPGYFEAMGIELVAGRTLTEADILSDEGTVVVDEGVVARLGDARGALGDAIRMAPEGAGAIAKWREVVGIVREVRYGLDADPRPRIYLPERHVGFTLRPRTIVVRLQSGAVDSVVPALRTAVRDVDPLLPIERIEWLDDISHSSISRSRLQGVLLTVFAVIALCLGAVGVYGVVSYTVTRRTREVGLRLALGASRGEVLADVVRNALLPVFAGLGAGLLGAAVLTRLLGTVAFGVEGLDPLAFLAAPASLLPIAIGAAFLPGLRASRVDPVRALREE